MCKCTVPHHPYSRRDGYRRVPPAWPKPVGGASYPISRYTYVVTHDTYAYAYTCDRDTVCKRTVPQHPYSRRDGYPKVPPAWPKPVVGTSYPISRPAYPVRYYTCAYVYTRDRDTVCKRIAPQYEVWIAYTKKNFARLPPRFRSPTKTLPVHHTRQRKNC